MRLKIIVPLLTAALMGCGPDYAYDCDVPWGSFTSEVPVKCDRVRSIFLATRSLLTEEGTEEVKANIPSTYLYFWNWIEGVYPLYNKKVVTAAQFNRIAGGIKVFQVKEPTYRVLKQDVWANYDILAGIKISNGHLCVLSHEVTHAIEASRLDTTTPYHKDWDKKGHNDKSMALLTWCHYSFGSIEGYNEEQTP